MFRKKISKTQQPDKGPYTIYNPHTRSLTERKWTTSFLRFCSIDPAVSNFAIRVESRPKDDRPDFIRAQLFAKLNLKTFIKEGEEESYSAYDAITTFLDEYLDLLLTCNIIVIERQLPENYRAVRISQHILSYFLIRLRNGPLLPVIIELCPKVKGRQLGVPPNLVSHQLKRWAVDKATELLVRRQDEYSLGILDRVGKKKDDLADTICQIEALCVLFGIPTTRDPPLIPPLNSSVISGRLIIKK